MTDRRLRIGTRGSALARWQADWIRSRLEALGVPTETVLITTGGDQDQRPVQEIGAEGLFTKEIQRALLEDRIDLAVHSLKDLPTDPADQLTLAAVPGRESPFDALVAGEGGSLESLPPGARVGTGSQRRKAQLLHQRPDLQVHGIRGNLDTRLRKVETGEMDAIVLAEAGLRRLEWTARISQVLRPDQLMPAVGQGALGLECRSDDDETRAHLAALDDPVASCAVRAERGLLAALRGGCSAPVGAWARMEAGQLVLDAVVLSLDGSRRIAARASGPQSDFSLIADDATRQLRDQDADSLIAAARE